MQGCERGDEALGLARATGRQSLRAIDSCIRTDPYSQNGLVQIKIAVFFGLEVIFSSGGNYLRVASFRVIRRQGSLPACISAPTIRVSAYMVAENRLYVGDPFGRAEKY